MRKRVSSGPHPFLTSTENKRNWSFLGKESRIHGPSGCSSSTSRIKLYCLQNGLRLQIDWRETLNSGLSFEVRQLWGSYPGWWGWEAEERGQKGTQVLIKTKVLLDMVDMKFFFADAPLNYLGPEQNSKSTERVSESEREVPPGLTSCNLWQLLTDGSMTNECTREKFNPTSNQGNVNQRDTTFTDPTGLFWKRTFSYTCWWECILAFLKVTW